MLHTFIQNIHQAINTSFEPFLSSGSFVSVPSMALNLAVKVRYGGTYQPTISEAQAIRREARSGESV